MICFQVKNGDLIPILSASAITVMIYFRTNPEQCRDIDIQVLMGEGAGKGMTGCHQWCFEAPTVPNGVGVMPDTRPNVGVTNYTYPPKIVLFMLRN